MLKVEHVKKFYGRFCALDPADGTVDEGYTGEIMVKLFNHGSEDYNVRAGDKISQLVVIPVHYVSELVPIEFLPGDSERGNDGFGSTGR